MSGIQREKGVGWRQKRDGKMRATNVTLLWSNCYTN